MRKVEQLMKEMDTRMLALEESVKALDDLKGKSESLEKFIPKLEGEDERLNELKDDLQKKSKEYAAAGKLTEKAD